MSIRVSTTKAPTSFFKPDQFGIQATFDIFVFVKDELAVQFQVIDDDGAVSVSLTKGILVVQVERLYMNDARVVSSQIGEIEVWSKRIFINWVISITLPILNKYLAPGIALPSEFFGMVRIKDAYFIPMDGHVQVGIIPEFF